MDRSDEPGRRPPIAAVTWCNRLLAQHLPSWRSPTRPGDSALSHYYGTYFVDNLRSTLQFSMRCTHFDGKPSVSKNARFRSFAALTRPSNDIT